MLEKTEDVALTVLISRKSDCCVEPEEIKDVREIRINWSDNGGTVQTYSPMLLIIESWSNEIKHVLKIPWDCIAWWEERTVELSIDEEAR